MFNQPIFPELVQIRQVPKRKLAGIVVAEVLQAECPSCHPTNSIKALKSASYLNIYILKRKNNSVTCVNKLTIHKQRRNNYDKQ